MRFQPIIVPRPSAMATANFTQVGMKLVTHFRALILPGGFRIQLGGSCLAFIIRARVSETR